MFDLTKLEWMNGEYLSLVPVADLLGPVKHHLDEMGVKDDGAASAGADRRGEGAVADAARHREAGAPVRDSMRRKSCGIPRDAARHRKMGDAFSA